MEVTFIKDKIHEARLLNNSFVSNIDTLENFNQIKGRSMTAKFLNDEMHQILVNGNGESIFFAINDSTNQLMGMNRIECSDINVNFAEGDVAEVLFLTQPDAKFIPPHELKKPEKELPGFEWKIDLKPTRDSIFVVTPIDSTLLQTDSLSKPKLLNSPNINLEIKEIGEIEGDSVGVEKVIKEELEEERTTKKGTEGNSEKEEKEVESEGEKKKETLKKKEEEERQEEWKRTDSEKINLKPKPLY
jgi:hypothetical protein